MGLRLRPLRRLEPDYPREPDRRGNRGCMFELRNEHVAQGALAAVADWKPPDADDLEYQLAKQRANVQNRARGLEIREGWP